jgi:hypothetical protein
MRFFLWCVLGSFILFNGACRSFHSHECGLSDDEGKNSPAVEAQPLEAPADWDAYLLIDNEEVGIWTVKAFQIFEHYASPEVVGLDDQGRCWVLASYSGKWIPQSVIHEKKWLGGLAHGDVDPRIPNNELYTGGQKGNLYQVVAYSNGMLDYRLIASFPGMEIHTILAGDLDPSSAGHELLIFTRPGNLYMVTPTGPHGTFESKHIQSLSGRVRDALVLPEEAGSAPEIATVSRAGELALLRLSRGKPEWRTVHKIEMGRGRIALKPVHPGKPLVMYTSADDGRIYRHERLPGGKWKTDPIFMGPQGPRGIVAGRFDVDPGKEAVAIFGYSGKVHLLSNREGSKDPWRVETIFLDRNKGHWLAAAELDGRNATQEIIGSGYGGRIFMLARPPGYGRPDLAVDD